MAKQQSIKNLNLGQSKAVLRGQPSSPFADLLNLLVQDVIDDLRKSLTSYDANASRNLQSSILPERVRVEGDVVSVAISAPFYWKFVNFGVNGTLINRGAPTWGRQPSTGTTFKKSIADWIRDRGIPLPPQFKTYEAFNYALRKSIREKGVKARPFYTAVVNERLISELEKPISDFMKRAITVRIVEPWR